MKSADLCVLIWKALLLLLSICTWSTNLSGAGLLTGDEAHNTHTHIPPFLLQSFWTYRTHRLMFCILLDVWLILVFQVPNLLWSWQLCCLSTFRWRQKLCLPNCFRDLSSVWFLDSLSILKTRELCGPRAEWSATLNTAHRTCLRPLFCDNCEYITFKH